MAEEDNNVVHLSPEMRALKGDVDRSMELTKQVYFHRGFWAGAVFAAVLTSFIWWVAS